MNRSSVLNKIFDDQPPDVQAAIEHLENAGLSWCTHFGTDNAVRLEEEMNLAFQEGRLYEWLNHTVGVTTE